MNTPDIFQSTHPVRGATTQALSNGYLCIISIHAPRAGCDQYVHQQRQQRRHFNPRTPCGVRQIDTLVDGVTYVFQSTHPVRGATSSSCAMAFAKKFQSTHPVRGATG